MAYLGLTMTDMHNGPDKIRIYNLHKSIGLTILALVTLRVLWRAWAGAPKPLQGPLLAAPRRVDHACRAVRVAVRGADQRLDA